MDFHTIRWDTGTSVTAWYIGTKSIDIVIIFELAFVDIFALVPYHVVPRVTDAFIRTISVIA